jgi:hypothetical protein
MPWVPSFKLGRYRVGLGDRAGAPGAERRRVWVEVGRSGMRPQPSFRSIELVVLAAVAVVMMVVPSVGHIKATMVPMPVSLTDPNSNAADPDIGTFRDDHRFVAGGQRTGKCRHHQERSKKKGKHNALHGILLGWGTLGAPIPRRMRARYS